MQNQVFNKTLELADILYNTSKNKTFRKWSARVLDVDTPWTENEIIYFRKAVNSSSSLPVELRKALKDAFESITNEQGYKITSEQTDKGIQYIRNRAFKRNGSLRRAKSNPFNTREAHIINNFSHFEFVGLYDANGNGYMQYYVPVYRVIAKDGTAFEYSTNMGQMEILA
jgi:hypothetical protein